MCRHGRTFLGPAQFHSRAGTRAASSTLFRLTNVNATTPGNPWFGYQVDLHSDLTSAYGINASGVIGASDPYGWRAGGIDPWGHFFSRAKTGQGSTGMGTWSPTMWTSAAETPPY